MIKDFTDLRVWQQAHALTLAVYHLTKSFPKEELYGIESQLRRSASSIGSNIAEGFSRDTKKEFVHFLYIARGSLSETINHLMLARDLGYCDCTKLQEMQKDYIALSKQLNALIVTVKNKYGQTHQ